MTKDNWKPDFAECIEYDERILNANLSAIRAAISHPGEKGSSVEFRVLEFLRSFLPAEYGLATGFIAYHDKCITGTHV